MGTLVVVCHKMDNRLPNSCFFTIIVSEISSKVKPEILNYKHGFDSMFKRGSMV